MEKQCIKCGKVLDASEFYISSKCKDGYSSWCKSCHRENTNKTRHKHKNYSTNNTVIKECTNCHRLLNTIKFSQNAYNIDGLNYWCKDCMKIYNKTYYLHHKEEAKIYNNERIEKVKYENKIRRLNDIYYKLNNNTLNLINACLKNKIKQSPSLEERCGYTIEQLRQHIESQFTPEMNWSNYGTYWELDHITPRFKFYYESYDDEQFKQCWALSNLRPLTIKENRERDKI